MRYFILFLLLAVSSRAELVPILYNQQVLAVVATHRILALEPANNNSTRIVFDTVQGSSGYSLYISCPIDEVQRQLKEYVAKPSLEATEERIAIITGLLQKPKP